MSRSGTTIRAAAGTALLLGAVSIAGTAAGPVPRDEGHETPAEWTALAFTGRVEARAPGGANPWYLVLRGDRLAASTQLRTGPDARATLTRGDGVLNLDPQSWVELGGLDAGPAVVQGAGSVTYDIVGGRRERFEVVTPLLTASTSGTALAITVGDGFAAATVEHGEVEIVNRRGDRVELRGGDAVRQDGVTQALHRVDLDSKQLRAALKPLPARHAGRTVESAAPPALLDDGSVEDRRVTLEDLDLHLDPTTRDLSKDLDGDAPISPEDDPTEDDGAGDGGTDPGGGD